MMRPGCRLRLSAVKFLLYGQPEPKISPRSEIKIPSWLRPTYTEDLSPERDLMSIINSHDKSIRPMPQYALSDLMELELLDVARNDRPMRVAHIRDVHAFLLELRQCIQICRHSSLGRINARALLRRLSAPP